MKTISKYTEAFRKQALEKVYTRGSRTIKSVADELNMNVHTLKNWITVARKQSTTGQPTNSKRPNDMNAKERLSLLLESHGMDENSLNEFCREKGIFRHHLQKWRAAFEADKSLKSALSATQLRQLKDDNKELKQDLTRKEKALAEAAALLVLQKKFQAFWAEKGV